MLLGGEEEKMRFKKILYVKKFDGAPKETDFDIIEEDIDENLKDGEFLYEALFVSCDPYLRLIADTYVVGETSIPGYQLSKVIKSNNSKYEVGHILVMEVGWKNGGKSDGSDVLYIRNDIPKNMTLSSGVGVFAMTGLTAYYGLDRVLKLKAGETIFISGAAGAVGTVAGQVAKILGCRVIGSCGSDEKIKFVKSVGYDDAFNYKTETVDDALKRLAPDGVDCYFDNVGGDFATNVLVHMKKRGRVAVCGAISSYNAKGPVRALLMQPLLLFKSILMQGYNIFDDIPPHADEIYGVLRKWAEEGKLKQYEHVTEGFDSLPATFISMLQGKYVGKAVVKI